MGNKISFGSTVTLKQAAQLIISAPNNRFCLIGEPGIGKSTLLSAIGRMLPDSNIGYLDVPNMDLGDIAMPVIDHEARVTRYYPNSRFRLHEDKPVVLMLDEFSKGADPIKNMLHPLLEFTNPRLGDVPLPPGSIIFLTGNLGSDGVGDTLKAHSRNRLTVVHVAKPSAEEWLDWAMNNEIDPVVMSWVHQFPHALASYLDGDQDSNPYIFNPKKMQSGGFVTPRSLALASNIVSVRHQNDVGAMIAALSGTIGESAARDMEAYITYQDQLPSWDAIIANPTKAPIPKAQGACAVMVFGAITKINPKNIDAFMQYVSRMEAEWVACFAINVARNPDKQSVAFHSAKFREWICENEDLVA